MKTRGLACLWFAWLLSGSTCWADGGTIQFSRVSHGLQISVFTQPGVPAAGLVDLSVLLQDASTHAAVLDADVQASLTPETIIPRDSAWAPPICAANSISNLQSFRLSHAGAQNLLYYASLVEIPSGGKWNLELKMRHGQQQAFLEGTLEVADPAAPWMSYWHLFLFPPIAIGLFAAIQRRKSRVTRNA